MTQFRLLKLGLTACLLSGSAAAEQYVITTDFNDFQPAQFKVILNGQPLLLYRNIEGNADITPWVKAGKNTLVVEVAPGTNANQFSKSVLTLGAGAEGKWRTLYKKVVGKGTSAGQSTFVFMAQPSPAARLGKVSLFGKFNTYQPVTFEVLLNGETISTMDASGNFDLTPFLKSGKNVLTVKYTPGKNQNQFSFSTLTVGQQVGDKWNSLMKLAIGKPDTKPGSVTFPIYR